MKVKRFAANTEADALKAVRQELGPDAIILETTRKKQGIRGVLGGGQVEVLAAVDDVPKRTPDFSEAMENAMALPHIAGKAHLAQAATVLLKHGVDLALAIEVTGKVFAEDAKSVVERVVDALIAPRVTPSSIERGTVMALVGPTGSGKTTTAAKICAMAALARDLKVLWIAADTFRVGGLEQATTYAEIMGVPLAVCESSHSIENAIIDHPEAEFVLLDTTGRNHLNEEQVQEVARNVRAARAKEVHLTIPAYSSWVQVQEILHGFLPTGYNRLTITKLDETSRIGTVLNLAGLCSVPMAYFTTGQTVPDDISCADPGIIREIIARGRADGKPGR